MEIQSDIKQLPRQFTGRGEVRGFLFTQLEVTDTAFLYTVEAEGTIYFEVFRKRENARYGCVSYPTSKAFGIWAWTYLTKEEAIRKLEEF